MVDSQIQVTKILEALAPQVAALLASGGNWKLTLHGGQGGHVKVEVLTTAQLVMRTPGGQRLEEVSQ